MAQPSLAQMGVIQENLQSLSSAMSKLIETKMDNIRDQLQTSMAQTSSETSLLKQNIETGRAVTSNTTLQNEIERLTSENKQLAQRLETERHSVQHLEKNQQLWKAKLSRLQAVITQGATNANEVIDSEVKAKVQRIRARIETIVNKYCVGNKTTPIRESKELEDLDNNWGRKRQQIPESYGESDVNIFLNHWIRSKIYLLLQRLIFSQPCFGLEKDLESKLGEFENLISKCAGGKYLVGDISCYSSILTWEH